MKKITDFLNRESKKGFVITAYMYKDTKVLIGIADYNEKEKENLLSFDFEFAHPTFPVLSEALKALYNTGGEVDTIRSGSIIFDACYVGNQGSLEEIKEHAELYTSLCAVCAEKAEMVHVEYKKK